MTMPEERPTATAEAFEAEASIGIGFQTLARNGRLTIADGTLTLYGDNGKRIAQAPVIEVSARPMRFSAGSGAKVTVKGEKYSVVATAFRYNAATAAGTSAQLGASAAGSAALGLGGSAVKLAGDVTKIKRGKELTHAVLAAIQASGGTVS